MSSLWADITAAVRSRKYVKAVKTYAKSCIWIHVHLWHVNCCNPQGYFYDPTLLFNEPQRTVLSSFHQLIRYSWPFPFPLPGWGFFGLDTVLLAIVDWWLNERSSQSWPLLWLPPFILRLMTETHTAALLYCVALPHLPHQHEVLQGFSFQPLISCTWAGSDGPVSHQNTHHLAVPMALHQGASFWWGEGRPESRHIADTAHSGGLVYPVHSLVSSNTNESQFLFFKCSYFKHKVAVK